MSDDGHQFMAETRDQCRLTDWLIRYQPPIKSANDQAESPKFLVPVVIDTGTADNPEAIAKGITDALNAHKENAFKFEAILNTAKDVLHHWDAFGCLTVENPTAKTVMRKFRDALSKAQENAQ